MIGDWHAMLEGASDCVDEAADRPMPALRYVVRDGTTPAAAVKFLQSRPGHWFSSSEVSKAAGTLPQSLRRYLDACAAAGYVRMRYANRGRLEWSAGEPCDIQPERRSVERMDAVEVELAERMRQPADAKEVMRLRTLFFFGDGAVTGDATLALAEAMQAAREALACKAGSRFKGAEVDLFVARELRAISEAAIRARDNLRAAVAGML